MELKERVRAAEERLREAVEARERGSSELNQMWQQVRDRFVEKDGELAGFRDRSALKDSELGQIRDRILQQEAQIEESLERIARQDVETAELRERAALQDTEIAEFQSRVAAKDEEIGGHEGRISQQSKDIAGHEARIATLTEQNQELSDSLEALLASIEGKVSPSGTDPMNRIGEQMRGLVDSGGAAVPNAAPAASPVGPVDAGLPDAEPAPAPVALEPSPAPMDSTTAPDDPTAEMSVGDIVATVQASHDSIADMGGVLQDALGKMGGDAGPDADPVSGITPPPALEEDPGPEPEPAPLVAETADPSESGIRKLMTRLTVSAKSDAGKHVKKKAIGRPQRKTEKPEIDDAATGHPAPEMDAEPDMSDILPVAEIEPLPREEPEIEEFEIEEPVIEEPVIEEPVIVEAVIEEAVIEEALIVEAVIEEALTEEALIEEALTEEALTEEALTEEPESAGAGVEISPEETDPHLAEELEEIESLRSGLTGLRDKIPS